MDVLSPELLWIEDRCYRLPVLDPRLTGYESDDEKHLGGNWEEADSAYQCSTEEPCESEYNIETTANGAFKMAFPIAKAYRPVIIGTKGATKKRIETETKTTVYVPRQAQSGEIVITGFSKRDVTLARRSIDAIIYSSRQKMPFTHFISLPMASQEIRNNFTKFMDEVLWKYGKCRGVDETIFQNPDKLHVTLVTLVLMDDNERKIANEKLQEIAANIVRPLLNNKRLNIIEMKGIEYMNDDPSEVDVLYGQVFLKNGQRILNEIADGIAQNFSETGLMRREDVQNVKLHVTLMNTLFREDKPQEASEETEFGSRYRRERKVRETFDATNILKEFQNFYFGEQELKQICISLRYSTAPNGYYQSTCAVDL